MELFLIEDNPSDAEFLCRILAEDPVCEFSVVSEGRLSSGLARLSEKGADLVLLDLGLPDSEGIDTLRRLRAAVPTVPIIVLTGLNDETTAISAVRDGAQDYLVKDNLSCEALIRAIRYARERHRLTTALQSWALFDELTGLYNRRGFVTLAAQQLKLAHRLGQRVALTFIDLDAMKEINDSFGHVAGDRALKATAGIMKSAFRSADVLARWAGDEFVAFSVGIEDGAAEQISGRLLNCLEAHNAEAPDAAPLSFCHGIATCDPAASATTSIEELIVEADQAMYEQKHLRQSGSARGSTERRARA